MDTENTSESLYSFIRSYELAKHGKNIHRIKVAIRCFFIIPLILLSVMFFTGSSNIAFLLLWIISLFGIAAYGIVIEYNDYELQKRMHIMELLETGDQDIRMEDLVVLPLINERELMRLGIDRDSTRTLLSMFNRQRRRRRAKAGAAGEAGEEIAEEAPGDAPAEIIEEAPAEAVEEVSAEAAEEAPAEAAEDAVVMAVEEALESSMKSARAPVSELEPFLPFAGEVSRHD